MQFIRKLTFPDICILPEMTLGRMCVKSGVKFETKF